MRKENSTKFPKERFCKVKILAHYIQGTTAIIYIHNRGIMRLYYNGRTIEDLKKYLEEKTEEEELKKLLEQKDKEDYEYQMTMMQNDNQEFSG